MAHLDYFSAFPAKISSKKPLTQIVRKILELSHVHIRKESFAKVKLSCKEDIILDLKKSETKVKAKTRFDYFYLCDNGLVKVNGLMNISLDEISSSSRDLETRASRKNQRYKSPSTFLYQQELAVAFFTYI